MAAASKVTLQEFLTMAETEPYSEYACGEVVQKPMPDRSHAAIQLFLAMVLGQFPERVQIGQAFTEFRCIFGPPGSVRAYVPDLSYVSSERLGEDRYLRTAPDLAVEILSRDQDMGRFLAKVQFYLRYGVRLVWVVDPERATVTVLAPDKDDRVLTSGDVLEGGNVLHGFTLAVDAIFSRAQINR